MAKTSDRYLCQRKIYKSIGIPKVLVYDQISEKMHKTDKGMHENIYG